MSPTCRSVQLAAGSHGPHGPHGSHGPQTGLPASNFITAESPKDYSTCAYFTLVMRGDEYVTAALALGASLDNSGTRVTRRYCMITDDVSHRARKQLARFWQVVRVDYLTKQRVPLLLSNRMREIYGSWIADSFTKWRCLQLASRLNVTRFVYLDADTIVLQPLDRLFAANGQTTPRVMTSMFPVFSTVPYHVNRYHQSSLYEQLRAFEEDEREDPLPWSLDVRRSDLRQAYFDATSPRYATKRHFLLNSSLVYFELSAAASELMFTFVESAVLDDRQSWYRRRPGVPLELRRQMDDVNRRAVSVFANGYDEQVLAEALIAFPRPIRLTHLRTFCNVNTGFWNSAKIKMQPWSMTWWGSNKPWNDVSPAPKYTDVYLFRYFEQLAQKMMAESFQSSSQSSQSSQSPKSSQSSQSSLVEKEQLPEAGGVRALLNSNEG